MRSPSEPRWAARFAAAGLVLVVVSGCSSHTSDEGAAGSSSAPKSSGSSGTTSTSSQSAGAAETQGPAAATPTRTDDPTLILANQPLYPSARRVPGSAVDITDSQDQIAGDGLLLTGAEGLKITMRSLRANAQVVWMSDSFVIDTVTAKACASACPALASPAGAKQVLVIDPAKVSAVGVDTPITK